MPRVPLHVGGAVLCAMLSLVACGGEKARPNVLLFTVDSLRLDHVSALGRGNSREPRDVTTPAFDRFASDGVLFENAVSTTSWTLPSHAALMTGLPDELHGVLDNFQRLSPGLVTLAELLQGAGYRTAGYFSGPNVHPAYGFGRGFERYVDLSYVDLEPERLDQHGSGDLRDVHLASHRAITSPALLAAARGFLDEMAATDVPFFLFVHWWDPHYDYLAPAHYVERFVDPQYAGPMQGLHVADRTLRVEAADIEHLRGLYDAEIRFTDDHLGELLEHHDRVIGADRTFVVWTADHGEEFYEHGRWGHQRTLFEDVVRIPLALRGPGVPAGQRVGGQARLFDIYTAVAAAADVAIPAYVQGRDLQPLWAESAHSGFNAPLRLRVPRLGNPVDLTALRLARHKVLRDNTTGQTVVYDLVTDPLEQRPMPAEQAIGPAASAVALFHAELAALETAKERLPGQSESVDLPDALRRQLGAAGYLGSGEDG